MYVNGSFLDRSRFMKNFRFDTICNITQELQEPLWERLNCASGHIWKYHQFLQKMYKCWREIAFRPVSNSVLLYLSLRSFSAIGI